MESEDWSESNWITKGIFHVFLFLSRCAIRYTILIGLVASASLALCSSGAFMADVVKKQKVVLDLIYWREPRKSGIVLAVTLILLYSLVSFPLILVFSYLGLSVLGGTCCLRLYKLIETQLKKKEAVNPFQPYLDQEIVIPQEKAHQQLDIVIGHVQNLATELKRLLLVENICDSVKFGLLLWGLTYIGSWFSGLCLMFMAVLGVFSVPKFYEMYQEPIDANLAVIKKKLEEISNMIGEKVPFLKCCKSEKHEKTT